MTIIINHVSPLSVLLTIWPLLSVFQDYVFLSNWSLLSVLLPIWPYHLYSRILYYFLIDPYCMYYYLSDPIICIPGLCPREGKVCSRCSQGPISHWTGGSQGTRKVTTKSLLDHNTTTYFLMWKIMKEIQGSIILK